MGSAVRISAAFVCTYAVGLLGYFLVDTSPSSWYGSLGKPSFTPPGWVFGIVWPILYAMMAGALSLIWIHKPQDASTAGWIRFYFVQLLFNGAWVIFFFGLHAVLVAFIDILFLAFIVIALIASANDINKLAAQLLVPYFLWIMFAGYITLRIWFLN